MDEPTFNLDLRPQSAIGELIRNLTISRSLCTALTLHDLNRAARFADTVSVVERGRAIYSGPPAKVLTNEMIADIDRVQTEIMLDEEQRPVGAILGPCPDNRKGNS